MEENQKRKDVTRALTTDEIRQQAHKWTLAGDVGLLAHLEQFSQDLLSKSQETQKNINELLDSVEDTSVTINNVTNQFLALQNSQFVENRVYDDDSPVEEENFESKISKEEQEKLLLLQYKEAVDIGIKILDTHFEEVQIPPNSDSDEEVLLENPGIIWKPKNPYAGKRFPLLIGSAEWWADDNVGLAEYEENVNPEVLSPESFSDMEAEDTSEKRIRMSSSSSTESERTNRKSKEQSSSGYEEDIFPTAERDMFNIQTNLFNKPEVFSKPPPIHMAKDNVKSDLSNSIGYGRGDISDSYSSKRNSNSLFDENSEEECNAESTPAAAKENKFQNDFAKELSAKLFSVANKNPAEPNAKPTLLPKSENETRSALFPENDDNDDSLFSVGNSTSSRLFKNKSLYSDVDDDDRFGDGDNLFSGSERRQNAKKTVTINPSKEVNGVADGGRGVDNSSKHASKSIKFLDDDLNGSNDDLLFTRKSSQGPSQNSGGASADPREVKFSTPTVLRGSKEVPNADNLFGGVSEIRSNGSSNMQSVSTAGSDTDDSFNFARYMSVETSRDYGFIEPSDVSNNKSEKSESPRLFEPKLSSTRRISYDTSDYKTHRISSYQTSSTKQGTTDDQRHQENSRIKIGNSENAHFSREQSESRRAKGLFIDVDDDDDDDDDEDDLFQARKPPKPIKDNSLFDEAEDDNLFSSLTSKSDVANHPIFEEKSDDSPTLFRKPSTKTVAVSEEDKPAAIEKSKQLDSVSMSSSRSSLFDDLNIGKSNLASVFEKDKAMKSTDDLFDASDDDLFGEKKTVAFEDSESVSLFRDNSVAASAPGSDKKNLSLFDDLDETDDLFGDVKRKNIFRNYENDEDLFGESTCSFGGETATDINEKKKSDEIFPSRGKSVADIIGSSILEPADESRSISDFNGERDNSRSDAIDPADEDFSKVRDGTQNVDREARHECKVTDLFAELEDETEDLFNSTESGKDSIGCEIEKTEISSMTKDRRLRSKNSRDGDDDFTATPSLENEKSERNSGDSVGFETEERVISGESEKFQNFSNSETTREAEKAAEAVNRKELNGDAKIEKTDNLFENDPPDLKVFESTNLFGADDFDDVDIFAEKSLEDGRTTEEGARPSPPSSLNIIKKLDLPNDEESGFSETDKHVISAVKPKAVGKLNIPSSLKINPMNLMPGAVMRKNVVSQRTDETDGATEPERDFYNEKSSEVTSNLLRCLTKDRVKIQTRRRSQTRKARHEALRSSGIDFPVEAGATIRSKSVDDLEEGPTSLPTTLPRDDRNSAEDPRKIANAERNSAFHSIQNSPEALFSSPFPSNPLSPSTDEEDYFNVPELDVNFEREDQSIFKSGENDFDRDDDNLLFDGAPVLSPLSPARSAISRADEDRKKSERIETVTTRQSEIDDEIGSKIAKNRILFEDDDDASLFGGSDFNTSGNSVPEKVSVSANDIFDDFQDNDSFLFQRKSIAALGSREITKKSLFEDGNDESDDLFGGKSIPSSAVSRVARDSMTTTLSSVKVNRSGITEKSKEPFIDPLGLMANPD